MKNNGITDKKSTLYSTNPTCSCCAVVLLEIYCWLLG